MAEIRENQQPYIQLTERKKKKVYDSRINL